MRILEPACLAQRRHPRAPARGVQEGVHSTRRDPIYVERVDRNHSAPQPNMLGVQPRLPPMDTALKGLSAFSLTPSSMLARQWGYAGLFP